jgi:molybdopterin-guanine dinucleotide biosynthesis protein A
VVGVLVDEGADVDGPMSALVEAVQSVTEEFVTFSPLPATEGTEFEQILRDDGLVVV